MVPTTGINNVFTLVLFTLGPPFPSPHLLPENLWFTVIGEGATDSLHERV